MSSCRPQVSVRAGSPGAAGVVTLTARAALADGGGEHGGGGPGGRGVGWPGRAVEPDDGVEVDDAAPLVFSDLGVGDPQLPSEGFDGQPGLTGQCPAEGDSEPAPQFGGAGVEQDRLGVVVTVWAQRLAQPVIIPVMLLGARQADAVRAGLVFPAWAASQHPAVLLPTGVDRAERRGGQGDEHTGVVGDGGGDALAAGQPRPDELIGVGTVDLGAGRASGGAAGLAGDRQDAAGLVDGGIAVDQFAGAAVDVVGAAAQQNWLQAPSGTADRTCGDGGGQRWYSSRLNGRAEACSSQADTGWFADQRCCAAWTWLRAVCRSGVSCNGVCTVTRASGESPARHLHGYPSVGEASKPHDLQYPEYVTNIQSISRDLAGSGAWPGPAARC